MRAEAGIATRAVGLIVEPAQAEAIIASGQADFVAMARAFLDDPRWVWHAAERLGAPIAYPPQYARICAAQWPGAAMARPGAVPQARQPARAAGGDPHCRGVLRSRADTFSRRKPDHAGR